MLSAFLFTAEKALGYTYFFDLSNEFVVNLKKQRQSGANMEHFAYMLKCADGTIYSGYTNDLKKRLAAHNNGNGAKYTRSRLPVILAYYESFDSKSDAMKREAAFKNLKRADKERLIATFKSFQ